MFRKKIIIKSGEEIELMRQAGRLAALTLKFAHKLAKPGISTGEIDKSVDEYIRDNKAIPAPLNYRGFPKSICTSINEVICHGIPSYKQILREGDIVNIDITLILNGYHGDTSSMALIGEVSEQAKKLVKVTYDCLFLGIKAVAPKKLTSDIGDAIEPYAKKHGYSVVRDFTGHGLGHNFHEEPMIRHYIDKANGVMMRPGMTFTIEPMINEGTYKHRTLKDDWTAVTKDHKLSAQFEHTILVTETGYEVLTLLEGANNDAPGGILLDFQN